MKTSSCMSWAGLFLIASAAAHAGDVVGLTTFVAGTPAKASEVSGNFNAVKSAVDDNHARITTLEGVSATGRLTALENIDMGPRLTALEALVTPLNAQISSDANPRNGGRP